jgi:orotate phosphoribosyltransferase
VSDILFAEYILISHQLFFSSLCVLLENLKSLEGSDKKVKFDVIFGPAYKGIPLGAVTSSALYSIYGVDVGYAYNRKEAKDHGEGGTLVGASMEGKRVLIIDDVITAGTAIRESFTLLQALKANPVAVVIALDRAEISSMEDRVSAVQAVARDLSLHVVSIINLPQLQTFLEQSPSYSQELRQSVSAYRNEFGV